LHTVKRKNSNSNENKTAKESIRKTNKLQKLREVGIKNSLFLAANH
jgi:hypothetical protein